MYRFTFLKVCNVLIDLNYNVNYIYKSNYVDKNYVYAYVMLIRIMYMPILC